MNDDDPVGVEAENLPAHVAICGLRYRELSRRLSRVEYLLYGVVLLITLGEGSLPELLRLLMMR